MAAVQQVRCLICGDVLSYQRESTVNLLVHLRTKHPATSLARLELEREAPQKRASLRTCKSYCKVFDVSEKSYSSSRDPCGCEPKCPIKIFDICGCDPKCQAKVPITKEPKQRPHFTGKLNSEAKQEQIKKLYRTTVETWKPGSGKIACPRCGNVGQPIVRRQHKKVNHSALGALCMLCFWPICFMPFMLCGTQTMNLHCSRCFCYLGTYDSKKSQLVQQNPTAEESSTSATSSIPVTRASKPNDQNPLPGK
ncbi:uncharacterized protein [Periplaneta americana]|uniref:uncharacterized protein n=1 Tax=Periplaneta americana TaxID=6978 RepID=UPI0037E95059